MVLKFSYTNKARQKKNVNNAEEVRKKSQLNTSRKTVCATPFRMPIAGYRKETNCDFNCENQTVIVDNFAQYYGTPQCYVPYVDRKLRLVGKDGFPNDNFLYSHNNRLIKQHKTFKQHQEVIIFEHNKDPKTNEYYISPADIPGNYNTPCTKSKKRAITVVKHNNRQFNQYGGVTQSSRLKRIKHNAILESQSKNCVNGDLCSLYYNTTPQFKPYRLGIIPQDKGCPTYIEVKGQDKMIIQGYNQANFTNVINFKNFKTNEYINGIPLIDIGNFNISFNFSFDNIYSACLQYSEELKLPLYTLNLYYDYGKITEKIILTQSELWPTSLLDKKKDISGVLNFDRNILVSLLPFSRTTEDDEIKFTFNGTFGSPVNFTTFYKETNVLPEVFLRNVDDFNNFQNLWWDYTYSGFDFSNNLVYVGNGLFPTNKNKTTVNGYDNEFDNAYERKFKVLSDYPNRYVLRYNQLMWNNGGFIAGQVTSYANPYIDYENAYFYPNTQNNNVVNSTNTNYSVFDNSGDDVSIVITKSSGIFWDDSVNNDVIINGRYKWLMIEDIKRFKNDSIKITVYSDTGSILKLGIDYLLYLQEINDAYTANNNTLINDPLLYPDGRSGWKACFKKFNPGYSLKFNNQHNAGNYITHTLYGENMGLPAYFPNIVNSLQENMTIYYRIGLKNGSNIKIGDIKIEYGNNDKVLAIYYAETTIDEDEFDILLIRFLYLNQIYYNNDNQSLLNRFTLNITDITGNEVTDNGLISANIDNNNVVFKLNRIVSSTESYTLSYSRENDGVNQKNNNDIFYNVDYLSSFQNVAVRNTVPPQVLFIFINDLSNNIYIKFNDNITIKQDTSTEVMNYLKSRFSINVTYYNGQTETIDLSNNQTTVNKHIDDIIINNNYQSYVSLIISASNGPFYNEGAYYDLSFNADSNRINGFSNSVNIQSRDFNEIILNNRGFPRIKSGHIDLQDPRIIQLEFDRDFSDNGISYFDGLNALHNDVSFNITGGSRGTLNSLKFNNYEISGNRIIKFMLDDAVATSEIYTIDYLNNVNWLSNVLNNNGTSLDNDLIISYPSSYYEEKVIDFHYIETFKLGKNGSKGHINIVNNVIAPAFLDARINPSNGKEIQLRLDKTILENNSLITDFDLSNNSNQGHLNSLYGIPGFTNDTINNEFYVDISLNNPSIKDETFDISYVKNVNNELLIKADVNGSDGFLGQFLYKNIVNNDNNYGFSHYLSGANVGNSLITSEVRDNSSNKMVVIFGENMKIINDGDGNVLDNGDFTLKVQDPNNNNLLVDLDISNIEINSNNNNEVLINMTKPIVSDYLIDLSYNGHCITNLNRFGFRLNNIRLTNKVGPIHTRIFMKPTDGTKLIIDFDVPIFTYDSTNTSTNRTTHNDLFELLTSNSNTIDSTIQPFIAVDSSRVEISLTNPAIYQEQMDISYVNTNLVSTYNSSVSSNYRIKNNSLYNDNAYDARSFFSIEVDNSNNKIYQPVLDKVEVIKNHLKSSSTEIKISFLSYGESYEKLQFVDPINDPPSIDDFSINTNDILKPIDLSENNGVSDNSIIITLKERDLYDLTQTYDISYNLANKIINQNNYTFKFINQDVIEWDYSLTNSYAENIGFSQYITNYNSEDYNFIKVCKIKNQLNYQNGDYVEGNNVFSNFIVKDMQGNTLTLGQENGYFIFYKEYSEYFDVNNNTLTLSQYNKSGNHQSGWKIGHVGFNPGATTANQNDDWQGGFRSHILNGPNIFSVANYNIKYSSTYQSVYVEYVLASKTNIKSIEFLYGLD